ncbi:MAG: acetylxylan esterase [Lachnospiraceae bacterium]|nr:acetylxylan esterase [Lachnospiraceae bacterium]
MQNSMDMTLEQLYQYQGVSPKAADFEEFWREALEELDQVEPKARLEEADFSCQGAQCFNLFFRGVRGARIRAKYLRPITPGPKPCVLFFHGYSTDSDDWFAKLPFVLENMCVAALDCRGQGGGMSEDNGTYQGYTIRGHITRGLDGDPRDLLYRQIFLDTVELARIVSAFPEVDENRLGTWGTSQGGALSLACSALHKKIKRTVVQSPFLSDYMRSKELGVYTLYENPYSEIGEYFRRFDPCHEREEEVFKKLSYIDVHNLAPWIKNPVFFTTGLKDVVCYPSTQFAVYNNLGGEKELRLYHEFGHEFMPYWQDYAFKYLQKL